MPLLLDGMEVGQLHAFFSKDGVFTAVDGKLLAEELRPYMMPGKIAELAAHVGGDGAISAAAIQACGIPFVFDDARLEAQVSIPAANRPVTLLDLTHDPAENIKDTAPPAVFSGYLNMLGGLGRKDGNPVSGQPGWQTPVLDFDGALRAFGTVLEGVVTYRAQPSAPWQRQDFRLVYDRPDERERLSLGDITYNISGFQSSRSIGGLALARSQDLQRGRSNAPAASTALVLERNSRVDIWVNGARVQTLQLAAGRYDIRNFPLALGANDVVVYITDEVGREETVRFPFVFDSALLARGEHDFSYVAGFLSQVTAEGRSYSADDPAFSAYHAVGLTGQFTVGASAQGSSRQQMAGAEGRWATVLGTVRVDMAASRADFAATGTAARLQYSYIDTKPRGDDPSLTAEATYRSHAFTALGDTVASDPYALDMGLVYSRRVFWSVLCTLGLGRQLGREGSTDGDNADLTLYREFGHRFLASLALSRRYPAGSQMENRAMLSFTINLGGQDMVTATQDSLAATTRLDWRHSAPRRVRSGDSDVMITHNNSSDTGQGELHYRDYLFSADTVGSLEQDRASGAQPSGTLSVNLGTAVAFADGQAALTRPIMDSFSIIKPHASLSGQHLEVNGGNGIPEAKTGFLSPAVLPELMSYEEHRIDIAAPGLPLWADLGPQPRYVYPPYRSGTLLIAGTGQVAVTGLLLDAAGQPLVSEPGYLEQLDDTAAQPQDFFTAKTGRFSSEGLKPGRFRLVLRNYPDTPFLLHIPAGSTGMVNIGELRLPPSR